MSLPESGRRHPVNLQGGSAVEPGQGWGGNYFFLIICPPKIMVNGSLIHTVKGECDSLVSDRAIIVAAI